ncbi:MAG: SBBP repeat-containing protein [Bacteroidetes bacterium]|nr:SBBP repeat-containing protein [Bacteroidota bacterium]
MTSLGNADMYLAKFDASNQLVWAKKRGISQDEYCNDAAIDSAGNIYSVGLWNTDVYVYKSNPMGDTVWTRRIAATQFYSSAYSVATDAAGNVYVTGLHYGLTLFPGTLGGSDVFVLKYNTNGTLLWSRTFGGTSSETGTGIAVDGSGNVYTIGNFRGLVDFNPSTAAVDTFFLTSNGSSDIFITKFDSSGTFRWAVHAGGLASDLARDIVTDALGNIYVSSVFVNMATYGSTVLTAVSSVSSDVAISKLDSNGNFIWTQQIGGTGTESSSGLDIDASGTLYLSGYFTDTADFDPGPGVFTLITKGATDVFVVKLSQLALTTEELVASATNVTVYPNPAGDEFTIRSAAALQNITLHSVIGEKILGIDNPSLTQKISIRDLPPGMYLVNGIGNGFRFSKKLIKSN